MVRRVWDERRACVCMCVCEYVCGFLCIASFKIDKRRSLSLCIDIDVRVYCLQVGVLGPSTLPKVLESTLGLSVGLHLGHQRRDGAVKLLQP